LGGDATVVQEMPRSLDNEKQISLNMQFFALKLLRLPGWQERMLRRLSSTEGRGVGEDDLGLWLALF
jgi:hypothetical protein